MGVEVIGVDIEVDFGVRGVEDLDGTGVNGIERDDMEVEGVGIDVRVGLTA